MLSLNSKSSDVFSSINRFISSYFSLMINIEMVNVGSDEFLIIKKKKYTRILSVDFFKKVSVSMDNIWMGKI